MNVARDEARGPIARAVGDEGAEREERVDRRARTFACDPEIYQRGVCPLVVGAGVLEQRRDLGLGLGPADGRLSLAEQAVQGGRALPALSRLDRARALHERAAHDRERALGVEDPRQVPARRDAHRGRLGRRDVGHPALARDALARALELGDRLRFAIEIVDIDSALERARHVERAALAEHAPAPPGRDSLEEPRRRGPGAARLVARAPRLVARAPRLDVRVQPRLALRAPSRALFAPALPLLAALPALFALARALGVLLLFLRRRGRRHEHRLAPGGAPLGRGPRVELDVAVGQVAGDLRVVERDRLVLGRIERALGEPRLAGLAEGQRDERALAIDLAPPRLALEATRAHARSLAAKPGARRPWP